MSMLNKNRINLIFNVGRRENVMEPGLLGLVYLLAQQVVVAMRDGETRGRKRSDSFR